MPTELRYQDTYVKVPRAKADAYYYEPWASLIAKAERGEDGLSVQHGRPRLHIPDAAAAEPDVCFLCEGQHDWRGRTVLHQQNW